MAQTPTEAGEFVTEPFADGVRYRLIRPAPGKAARGVFWTMIVVGLVVIVFMLFWMGGPMSGALRRGFQDAGDIIGFCFGLLGLPGLLVGVGIIVVACYVRFGRTTIEVADGRLTVIDSLGLLRWRRSRSVDAIRAIELHGAMEVAKALAAADKQPGQQRVTLTGLRVQCDGGGSLPILCGLTPPVMRELADALAAEVDAVVPPTLTSEDRVKVVEVAEEEPVDPVDRDRETAEHQPDDSDIDVDRRDDGLTLNVPPTGLRGGKNSLFKFGLLWCGFMVLFTAAAVFGMVAGDHGGPGDDRLKGMLIFAAFIGLFWAVGLGMLGFGWVSGRRYTVIDVVGDTLLITQVSPLGTRQYEWPADQIRQLRWGPSDVEVNDEPVMCLRIEPTEGKTRKLLAERDDDELQWLAALLRVELRLTPAR